MEGEKRMKKWAGIVILFVACVALCPTVQAAGPKIGSGSVVHLDYSFQANGMAMIPEGKKESMQLVVGKGAYPPAFEQQLVGLKKGDIKEIRLTPEQAFGPYRAELVKKIAKSQLPQNLPLREGLLLGGKNGQRPMRIAKVLDDSVIFDENHPLAGKTLDYRVQVTDVK